MELTLILGLFILTAIVAEILKTRRSKKTGFRHVLGKVTKFIPHALTLLVMVAHASEFTRVVSHLETSHIAISALLFGIWVAGVKNAEEV
jgi:hypothetical protein